MKEEILKRKMKRQANNSNKLARFINAGKRIFKSRANDSHATRNVVPSGGKFLNFRIVMKFSNGKSSLLFTDKQGAYNMIQNFKNSTLFYERDENGNVVPYCTEICVNLKNRPEIVIERLNRKELRRAIFSPPVECCYS